MYYVHTYMTFQYKSSLSGRTIKRGEGVKPSEPLRKKHFIFYDLKNRRKHKNININIAATQPIPDGRMINKHVYVAFVHNV